MKKLLYKLIDLYLTPLNLTPSLSLFAKHRILHDNEHLYATVHFIKKQIPGIAAVPSTIIDAGAFNGDITLFFAKHFPQASIISFEANPAAYQLAISRCAPYPKITFSPYALDSQPGEKDFFISDNQVSSSLNPFDDNNAFHFNKKIKVRTTTLDEQIKADKILLLKLDVQGGELNVLKGAQKTLRKTSFILTEMNNHTVYEKGCQYYEVDALLRENNFKLVNITAGYNYAGLTEFDALYQNTQIN